MKLRRALVTAAATAAIAPIALLSAPGAFATETPGTATESAQTTPSAPETTPETTPSETPATNTPSPTATGTPTGTGTPTDTGSPTKSTSPSPTTTKSPSESAEPTSPTDECTDIADEDDPGTVAELRGLPSKIVAGSGWHGFTYRIANKSDRDFDTVFASLFVSAAADDADFTDTTKHLTVQWFDGKDWQNLEIGTEQFLPFTSTDGLKPGDHADAKLRIKVDAKAPAGWGAGVTLGMSVDESGLCSFNDSDSALYEFDILAADATPGKVTPATAKPKPSNTPAPQGSSTPVSGALASTGSSSVLPTVGLVGGLAVVAGAGVVYSVRRRKVGSEA
ncbi:hypothetical protein G3I40_41595 [Streptomyces sp. SID14478]|uniref:hypothetical protein n=1 Tax=Streptomyces sp. SID14478 TaxID=2706073 RepID=UPI0013E0D989|nr:hypothetical protein [Streptomyces sp. SID14478]NEB81662.1 hypothetical protein [Streptomyces sp. SID14478]